MTTRRPCADAAVRRIRKYILGLCADGKTTGGPQWPKGDLNGRPSNRPSSDGLGVKTSGLKSSSIRLCDLITD